MSERALRRASAIHREPKPALLHPRRGHVTAAAREVRAPRDALRGANLRSRRVFVIRRIHQSRIRAPPGRDSLLRPRRRGEHVQPLAAPVLPPVAPRLRVVVVWDVERAAAERGRSTEGGSNRRIERLLILGDSHVPHGVVGDVRAEPVLFRDAGRGGWKVRRARSAGAGGDRKVVPDGSGSRAIGRRIFSSFDPRGWIVPVGGWVCRAPPGSSGRVRAHLIVQVGRVQRELLERGGERRAALTRVALEGVRHSHDPPFTNHVWE